jgi:hypothetical protein
MLSIDILWFVCDLVALWLDRAGLAVLQRFEGVTVATFEGEVAFEVQQELMIRIS